MVERESSRGSREDRGSSRGSKQGRGSSHGGQGMGGSTPKARLQRTTAKKDREYQADHLVYDDDSVHFIPSPGRSPVARENHKSIIRQQSFRVGGNEGDLQALYEFLGVASSAGLGIEASDWEARKSIVNSRPPSPPSVSQGCQSSSSDDFKGFQPNSFDSSAGSPPLSPVMSPARPVECEWKPHGNAVIKLQPVSRAGRENSPFKRSPPPPTRLPQNYGTLKISETFPAIGRGGRLLESSTTPPLCAMGRESFELNRSHPEPLIPCEPISPPGRAEYIGPRSAPSDGAGGPVELESSNQGGDMAGSSPLLSDNSNFPVAALAVSSVVRRSSMTKDSHRTKSIGSLRWKPKLVDEEEESSAKPAVEEVSAMLRSGDTAPEIREVIFAVDRTSEKPSALIVEKVENALTVIPDNANVETVEASGVLPKKPSWSSWAKGEFLGSGTFGTVYEGVGSNGMFFAVKEVSLSDQGRTGKQAIRQLEQEIALLSEIQHPNIVQYLGTERDDEKLYIFLELVSKGSLAHVYRKYEFFYDQVRAYTKQILSGLKYLHDRKIIHRDIKCANILVDTSGVVKLADFGMAKQVDKLGLLKSFMGSAHWMAPEVVNPKRSYNLMADIWSLGCTVLEMATGRPPFGDLECHGVLWKVGHGEGPPIPDELEDDLKDFILNCLEVNVASRPTCDMLLSHPFITGVPMSGPVKLVGTPELSLIAEERSIDISTHTDTTTNSEAASPRMITNMVNGTSIVRGGQPKSMRTRRSELSMSSSESVAL